MLITVPRGGYAPSMTFSGSVSGIEDVAGERQVDSAAPASEPSLVQASEPPKRESRILRWILVVAGLIVLAAVVLASFAERDNPALKEPVMVGGRSTIYVEQFRSDSDSKLSAPDLNGLRNSIIVNLSKFTKVAVLDGAANEDSAVYLLQGTLQREGDDLRSLARLVRQADRAVVWSGDYNINLNGRSMLDVEAAIARSISSAIAAPFEERVVSPPDGAKGQPR